MKTPIGRLSVAIRGAGDVEPHPMNSKTRSVLAGIGLAALGSAGAYGITATAVDLRPADEPQEAATAIEYGLIAALASPTDVEARGLTFNFLD